MFFITGDRHGDLGDLKYFCEKNNTTKEDVLIMLGDVALNYFQDDEDLCRDFARKEFIKDLEITLFCIHGNHEARPENIDSYHIVERFGGNVYIDPNYPNQIFAIDGEVYDLNGKKTLVVGGAYSVDKHFRIARGWHWFEDEQPSKSAKERAINNLGKLDWKVDVVLTHTCPYSYEPTEWFLNGIDQSTVDITTEKFLDYIEERTDYERWYCGHFHGEKKVDKIRFLFKTIEPFCS